MFRVLIPRSQSVDHQTWYLTLFSLSLFFRDQGSRINGVWLKRGDDVVNVVLGLGFKELCGYGILS